MEPPCSWTCQYPKIYSWSRKVPRNRPQDRAPTRESIMRHRFGALGLAWLLAIALPDVWADSWATPRPRTVDSADSSHALKILLSEKNPFIGPADGVLVRREKGKEDQVLWRAKLV